MSADPTYVVAPGAESHRNILLDLVVLGPTQSQYRPRRSASGAFFNAQTHALNEFRTVLSGVTGVGDGSFLFGEDIPLSVKIVFFMKRPDWHFRRGGDRQVANLRAGVDLEMPHTGTPDTDNLAKFVLDAMQGVVYRNDRVVFSLLAIKVYDNFGSCGGRTAISVDPFVVDLSSS